MSSQIQYAEWKNFESAWFIRLKGIENWVAYTDSESRSIPIGFLKRKEAKAWMDVNYPKLKYELVRLTEEEILHKWYYFVKIVDNVDPDFKPTKDYMLDEEFEEFKKLRKTIDCRL